MAKTQNEIHKGGGGGMGGGCGHFFELEGLWGQEVAGEMKVRYTD